MIKKTRHKHTVSIFLVLFSYLHHSLGLEGFINVLLMWMCVKEKGKAVSFPPVRSTYISVRWQLGLFLHPMMLCMQDSSLKWIKQLGASGMLTDIVRILTSTAQFISQSRQKWWLAKGDIGMHMNTLGWMDEECVLVI